MCVHPAGSLGLVTLSTQSGTASTAAPLAQRAGTMRRISDRCFSCFCFHQSPHWNANHCGPHAPSRAPDGRDRSDPVRADRVRRSPGDPTSDHHEHHDSSWSFSPSLDSSQMRKTVQPISAPASYRSPAARTSRVRHSASFHHQAHVRVNPPMVVVVQRVRPGRATARLEASEAS